MNHHNPNPNLSGSLSESSAVIVYGRSSNTINRTQSNRLIKAEQQQLQPQSNRSNQKSLDEQLKQFRAKNYQFQTQVQNLEQRLNESGSRINELTIKNRQLQTQLKLAKELECEYENKVIPDLQHSIRDLQEQSQIFKKQILKFKEESKQYQEKVQFLENKYSHLAQLSQKTTNEYQLKIIELNLRTKSIQQKFDVHRQKLGEVDQLRGQINKANTFFNEYNQKYHKLKQLIQKVSELRNQIEVQVQSSNHNLIQQRLSNQFTMISQEYQRMNEVASPKDIQIILIKQLINGSALNIKFLIDVLNDSVKIGNFGKYQSSLKGIVEITEYLERISI